MPMRKSKREWRCANCSHSHLKWEGSCRNCGEVDTLQEIILVPTSPKSTGTDSARKLRRRAKDSERGIAKRMVTVDGPDPAFAKIASSTGRIGHITGIRVDAISRSYVTENKNRKIPTWMADAWLLINQRAMDFNKNALLHVEPPNMPKEFPLNGTRHKLDTMAIITQTRHEELIRYEKAIQGIVALSTSNGEVPADVLDLIYEALQK
jgi:hypothetical protein